MARNTDLPVAPPLPAGSVDFNALHTQVKRGADAEAALNAAVVAPADEEGPADATASPETMPEPIAPLAASKE